jgi:hypothetical protein
MEKKSWKRWKKLAGTREGAGGIRQGRAPPAGGPAGQRTRGERPAASEMQQIKVLELTPMVFKAEVTMVDTRAGEGVGRWATTQDPFGA